MKAIPPPRARALRGYAIDPSLSTALLTMQVNELTYNVEWEELKPRDVNDKSKGTYPVGEYLEIVDYDPASDRYYEPVNLDHPYLLAQDGFAPSVSNPQFHQQFVYAVMMTTIKNFERALGRKILWGENIPARGKGKDIQKPLDFGLVQRLRVYPHALRQANAFYDPNRKALLFGYFQAMPASAQLQLPGATIFTCLSHDIIAHETTHAILDGVHRRYIDATHPDTRAFHEAFADIVALFQHFSFPAVLRHQIARTRGDLNRQNILGQLAQQFGQAMGGYGSLRDAIGEFDQQGNWQPHKPNPNAYATQFECHQRGALLVAAVFEAFLNIYQSKVQKIVRIATGGSGRLPEGELHPDLVDEMASTAAKTAGDVQRLCIRALDYCPPFDITFGEFLRGIITADFDMVANDTHGYRVAFVEAFQKRGISADGILSMAVEDLLYPIHPEGLDPKRVTTLVDSLREIKNKVGYSNDRRSLYDETKKLLIRQEFLPQEIEKLLQTADELVQGSIERRPGAEYQAAQQQPGDSPTDLHWLLRQELEKLMNRKGLHQVIEDELIHSSEPNREAFEKLTGMRFFPGERKAAEKLGFEWGYLASNCASFAIGNVSLANRVTPDDTMVNHVIITLAQKRGVRFIIDGDDITVDEKGYCVPDTEKGDRGDHIVFRGGCTLVFDLDTQRLRYAIKKDIDDHERMIRQYRFEQGLLGADNETYFASQTMSALAGPFAFTHSHHPSH